MEPNKEYEYIEEYFEGIKELQKEGHTINIFTTSFRKKIKIRITLGYYGIHVKKIINQKQNIKTLQR